MKKYRVTKLKVDKICNTIHFFVYSQIILGPIIQYF